MGWVVKMLTFEIPVKTISEANSHGHWRVRHKRRQAQRETSAIYTRQWLEDLPAPPLSIRLTRLCPVLIRDSDNLPVSMKAVRDGIADAIGIDDGDKRLVWEYGQRRRKEYGVEVTIEPEQGDDGKRTKR